MPAISSDTKALVRIQRELMTLSSLKHDHIIAYRGVRRDGDIVHILMEHAHGGSLRDAVVLRRESDPPFFPSDLVLLWAAQLASALAAVHRSHILHRDIKSENVFLTAHAQVKLGDFGLSRRVGEGELATSTCGARTPPVEASLTM